MHTAAMNRLRILILLTLGIGLCQPLGRDPPPRKTKFRILFLMPFGLYSHRNTLFPIAEALADRGHEVTFLTGLKPLPTESSLIQIQHDIVTNITFRDFFERRKRPVATFEGFAEILPHYARELYSSPIVKPIYEARQHFDVFVVDSFFNEFTYPFVHGKPFILSNAIGINPTTSSVMGNVINPSVVAGFGSDFDVPTSLWERLRNLYHLIHFPLNWRHIYVIPPVQKEISRQFPDLPPLLEIERRASLTFSQSHFALDSAIPLLPSQIEIGGHICREPKALPKVYENFVSQADDGVVYFSLGGVSKGRSIPPEYRQTLLKAFSKIPQKVIMKYEDELSSVPSNVMVANWLPQQDLLGHPNVVLFITHGGRLGYVEAVCHAVPMLAIPILGDQLKNAKAIERKGFGKYLVWEELSVDEIVTYIHELTTDSKYREAMMKASHCIKDQPEHPLQRAAWWTEYVARTAGAPMLRSPAADFSWAEYFMLDVVLLLHVIAILVVFISKRTFRRLRSTLGAKLKADSKDLRKKKRN